MSTGTLADLLLATASEHGHREALITRRQQMTWADLLDRSLRLAAALRTLGLRPGERVAFCLAKGPELSIALFATLLAGGVYVPIDHATPLERLRLILHDAGARIFLSDARCAAGLFGQSPRVGSARGREVVVCKLDSRGVRGEPVEEVETLEIFSWQRALAHEPEAMTSQVGPHDPAYILYTSGSTGRPKGVVQTHGGALAFVRWANAHLALSPEDVLSQHAGPSFDLTIFDFFSSALAGATLVSVPEWIFGRVGRTCRFIARQGISVWYSVPSALLGQGEVTAWRELAGSNLRHVVFAGEVLPKEGTRRLARYLPEGCTLSNWYGPTETNVCTYHDITSADLSADGAFPIGIPCPYAEARLATEEGLVPLAEPAVGELLVASPTVMAGYRGLEEQTARSFVEEAGVRFYRTGDQVGWNGTTLDFEGRLDRMLKVRGYRVQPEEVEEILTLHPAIDEAAVVVVVTAKGQELAAMVVTGGGHQPGSIDLEEHCRLHLPPYMVPSRILVGDTLPRGGRGKVDLAAVAERLAARDVALTSGPRAVAGGVDSIS